MTITDEWAQSIQQGIADAERWAQEHPLGTAIIIIIFASVGTVIASKAYDIWTRS